MEQANSSQKASEASQELARRFANLSPEVRGFVEL